MVYSAILPDPATSLDLHFSTLFPKRVPRLHRTTSLRVSRAWSNLTTDEVELLMAALYTNQGVANLLVALFSGGSCIVAPGFDPVAFPKWIADHQPTVFVATPTQITMLLDGAAAAGRETVVGPHHACAGGPTRSATTTFGNPRACGTEPARSYLRRIWDDRGQLYHWQRTWQPGSAQRIVRPCSGTPRSGLR